jgi:hypothetical protein
VAFGFFPGIVLNLISGPADVALGYVAQAQAIAVDPLWVAAGLGLIVAIVAIRFASLRPSSGAQAPAAEAAA